MHAELLQSGASDPAWRDRLSRLLPALMLAASRSGGVALQFLLQVVVGGMAGPAGLGVLQLFASWSSLLGEGLARGLPAWAMRVAAVDTACGKPARVRNNLDWAVRRIASPAVIAGLAAWLVLTAFDNWITADYRGVVLAVIPAAPLCALLRLGAETLKGSGEALLAVSIENLVLPAVVLTVCTICWFSGQALTPTVLLCAGVAGTASALWAAWKAMPELIRPAAGRRQDADTGHRDTSDINALWANSLLAVAFLQLPFLLMPWFAAPMEIGVYAVAHKLLNVVTTLLILLAAVFGPAFARAAHTEGADGLRRLLRRTQWLSCAIFLPLCTALLLAVEPLASLFNVPEDTLGRYLWILAGGQLVNAATGLSGVLLNMAGGAARETWTLGAALVVATVAAPAVGTAHGAPGLAALFSAVMAAKNIASYLSVSRFLSREEKTP